jgi:formate dehydrogenase iron-sulfur subunit
MTIRILVPSDTTAIALGANELADAIRDAAARRQIPIELVRNGSRGLFWLEPLVEVQTPGGRVGYGNVESDDVEALFDAGFADAANDDAARAGSHPKYVGLVEEIPYLKRQQRLTFSRIGIVDPLSIDDYVAHGGLEGLRRALTLEPAAACQSVIDSGLRGRGGAAFPAGIKWRTVLQAQADQKYVVCNADEGDSGTFSDRLSMECDPFGLIEGMTIAGISTGATQGYIYVRSEYPLAIERLNAAIARAREAGWLGADVLGSGRAFDLFVAKGAGSYVCGEETALLESLEGKRGIVRAKPPLPALSGYNGKPTVINNVITLASVPIIFARGEAFYRDFGMGRSRGTLPFQLAGNIRHGGLVELAFGVTLRELMFDFGGGTASGRPARAAQVGGPLGTYLPESQWDIPLDYEAYAAVGAVVGHGGIVVHDDTSNLAELARYAMHFCAVESCGKCTPCRIGSTRGAEVIDKIRDAGQRTETRERQVVLLRELCDTMLSGSLCAMGGMTPYPVLSALNHFPEDFGMPATRTGDAPDDNRHSAAA